MFNSSEREFSVQGVVVNGVYIKPKKEDKNAKFPGYAEPENDWIKKSFNEYHFFVINCKIEK